MADTDITNLDIRYLSHAALQLPGGGELYYEDRGEGPVITLLNNFYIVSPVWRNFTDQLENRFRLVSYDLRNQGASSPGTDPVTFKDHVEDVRRLLDHLGIEKTYLVGTSISTLIARDFANTYPESVAGLVLVGLAFSPNGSLRRKLMTRSWLASLEAGSTKQLFDLLYPLVFCDQMVNSGGSAAYLALRDNFLALLSNTSIRENLLASLDVDDDPEDLARLQPPTLIINGDGEFVWSASMVEEALALIPDATAVTLKRAGHVPFFDDPAGFQKAITEFVRRLEAVQALPAAAQHI
ncbi:alpha/beta fold hydrolase [Streptantibioticus ferralitis]|uniref:Alpha/beta hydrolase n=1 Tax=Streptantibioticus ferralitis TaxID=236510 RepID=A0ABT5Z9C3_9ACTN|nr:alpha/beta hydrolase [Streptantibioticus ferralitis]MDF2260441.1 alpha/beta hydrolase [Streptantibioticus ferralitis]